MHQLDLGYIDTYSLSRLAIADLSIYDSSLSITNPTIEISAPGYNKVSLIFTPQSVNIFNASDLTPDCTATTPLPDGIYTVKYSVSPNATTWVEKSFMRISQIACTYQRVFLAIDLSCSCQGDYKGRLKQELRDARLLIEGSVAAANDCNKVDAYALYNKASNLLSKISKCQCK